VQALTVRPGTANSRAILEMPGPRLEDGAPPCSACSAVSALRAADTSWLRGLITRRVPAADFADAFRHRPADVKVVLDLSDTVP
jgi:hypothetical protein